MKTKDGRTVWILDKSKRVVGEDGNEYLNCVLTDITQIKQSQEELRLTMERYRIIQDQTNDIIFEGDIELSLIHIWLGTILSAERHIRQQLTVLYRPQNQLSSL